MKKNRRVLDRPFNADVLVKARELAGAYQIVTWQEDGRWYGRGVEYPNVYGDGTTEVACLEATRDAIISAVAYELEKGMAPAIPAREGKRTEQVNIRLSAIEKLVIESASRRLGYRGIADYIRATALEAASSR